MGTKTIKQHREEINKVVLSGDPYADFSLFGLSLHGCQIRYRRAKSLRFDIITVTGRFDIGGKETTGRGSSYRDLVLNVVSRCLAQRDYLRDYRSALRSGVPDQFISPVPMPVIS